MTTAVYCHKTKQIAIDSRLSMNERIITDSYEKVVSKNEHIFFTSGSIHNLDKAVSLWFVEGSQKWSGSRFSILVVAPDKGVFCFYSCEGLTYKVPVTYNDGVGSGCDWALTALDFGLSVKDAILYAMTKDSATGGRVWIYDIESSSFIE
jgi:hypothetical protein